MGKLSHVSQEDSHMIEGYKYLFLEQTSSFSSLFFLKYWIRHILKRRHIVWGGEICSAEVRTWDSDATLGQRGGTKMINKSTNQVRYWSVYSTPVRCAVVKKGKHQQLVAVINLIEAYPGVCFCPTGDVPCCPGNGPAPWRQRRCGRSSECRLNSCFHWHSSGCSSGKTF